MVVAGQLISQPIDQFDILAVMSSSYEHLVRS